MGGSYYLEILPKLSLSALLNAFIKGNVEDPFHIYGEFVLGEYESRIPGSSPVPIVHLHLGICDSGLSFLCNS